MGSSCRAPVTASQASRLMAREPALTD